MEIFKNRKPVFLYDTDYNFLKLFNSTEEFSKFCGYEVSYIYHNLKYCKKIRIRNKWYVIRRNKISEYDR